MITNLRNKKIRYLLLAITTIIVGLASRKLTFIPAVTGDILYAVMVYWFCRLLFYDRSNLFSITIALVFCFLIECLQLVQIPFLIYIRNNPVLRLIFGQGFLWSDLIGYLAGATLAFLLDNKKGMIDPPKKM